MKEIYLITGNEGKLKSAKSVFSRHGIEVKQIKNDYPEIQADSGSEIARYTASKVAKDISAPVIREDPSLFINSLKGFPGPYTNYFDRVMPVETLVSMISSYKDKSAYMELAAALAFPDGNIYDFTYQVPLKIADTPKGEKGNWDKVLMLSEDNKTFSESDENEREGVWNKNYEKIAKFIQNLK